MNEYDISKIGFALVSNYATKAKAAAAARAAGFGAPQSVYTRFTSAWIVGYLVSAPADYMHDRLVVLAKNGARYYCNISRGKSCIGSDDASILSA